MKKQISLKEIVKSKRLRARVGRLDPDHVEGLAYSYGKGEDVEVPRVWDIKGLVGFYLTRGFHRVAALEKAGRSRVECEIKTGSFEDALLDAVQGDLGHGLRRSNKDKRRCVELVLSIRADWSDKVIAEKASVSQDLVAEVRAELPEPEVESKKTPPKPGYRLGRDGKWHPGTQPTRKNKTEPSTEPSPAGTPDLEAESKPGTKELHAGLVKLVKFAPTRSKADEWLAGIIKLATALADEIKES